MTADAGMTELISRMRAARNGGGGPGVEVHAELDLSGQLGRLCGLLERDRRRRDAEDYELAQAASVIDIPPMDYVITGGHPKFKQGVRAAPADASPQEGFYWFVTRLTLAGMNAGDTVNIFRPAGTVITNANSVALHTFLSPGGVSAGLGVADWEPGVAGLIMRPDDIFILESAGTLAASEIILSGQALQITAPYLARFIL